MTSGKRVTVEEKARILELIDKGLTAKQLAARFGIALTTIYCIKKHAKEEKLCTVDG